MKPNMKIFDNGNVSINCLCPSRSQMNYNGYIDIDTDR